MHPWAWKSVSGSVQRQTLQCDCANARPRGLTGPGNPPPPHGLRNSSPAIDLISESGSFQPQDRRRPSRCTLGPGNPFPAQCSTKHCSATAGAKAPLPTESGRNRGRSTIPSHILQSQSQSSHNPVTIPVTNPVTNSNPLRLSLFPHGMCIYKLRFNKGYP